MALSEHATKLGVGAICVAAIGTWAAVWVSEINRVPHTIGRDGQTATDRAAMMASDRQSGESARPAAEEAESKTTKPAASH